MKEVRREGDNVMGFGKMPGMFSIIASFIPWIVYWVLCGFGNRLGVVVSFLISIFIMVFQSRQARRSGFSLMGLASVLYFSAAFVGTFVFNWSLFIEQSVFLGYFALFFYGVFLIGHKAAFHLPSF